MSDTSGSSFAAGAAGGAAPSAFELDVSRVVEAIRRVVGELIDALPRRVSNATDLARASGLDLKLCWKIVNMLQAPGALPAAWYVPGPANMASLRRALARRGASAPKLEQLQQLERELDELIERHAGDRRTFEAMVAHFAEHGREPVNLEQRRAAFRANSHLLGLRADVAVSCYILRPSPRDPSRADIVNISILHELRRLRRTRAPLLCRSDGAFEKTDEGRTVLNRPQPLVPDARFPRQLPLIAQFCENLPRLQTRVSENGYFIATLPEEMIGRQASVTLVSGQIVPSGGPRYGTRDDDRGQLGAQIHTPVEELIFDLILDAKLYDEPLRPTVSFYLDRTGTLPYPLGDPRDRVVIEDLPVDQLGRGADAARTPLVPRYSDVLEYASRTLGLDAHALLVHRCRLPFPILMSHGIMSFVLPRASA